MDNFRKYGTEPYQIAVVHGGPGAAGELAHFARELSKDMGVLEPLQTKLTLVDQVNELEDILKGESNYPVTLIGHSWGAWLSYLVCAQNPDLVKKLILVGSGPFEKKYAVDITENRMNRLDSEKRTRAFFLLNKLSDLGLPDKDEYFAELGRLISKADAYDPISHDDTDVEYRYDIFQSVWPEGDRMRDTGQLLSLGKQIYCPVVAIHGDYDPHPYEGVEIPLASVLKDFRFKLIENCGHDPWYEQEAKDDFYRIIKKELY